jgi:hypothetical protein
MCRAGFVRWELFPTQLPCWQQQSTTMDCCGIGAQSACRWANISGVLYDKCVDRILLQHLGPLCTCQPCAEHGFARACAGSGPTPRGKRAATGYVACIQAASSGNWQMIGMQAYGVRVDLLATGCAVEGFQVTGAVASNGRVVAVHVPCQPAPANGAVALTRSPVCLPLDREL